MTFTIPVQDNGKIFNLKVELTKETELLEDYTVLAGDKRIVFRNNRPEKRKFKTVGKIVWRVVSKNFSIAKEDMQKASAFMLRIQDAIEAHIEPQKTFEAYRNKR